MQLFQEYSPGIFPSIQFVIKQTNKQTDWGGNRALYNGLPVKVYIKYTKDNKGGKTSVT